ncbi:Ubiquinone biosynthesis protein COQ9, mitochondrial [Alteripontixanthobacter maritimus]|uniref:Ubiquinone biosynthesis protein COQ9, mitochondrial n=1 Tax=Alteripontixanthobacter maritimus TaxID=2161824 RepID=A0A369Q3K3_9SPHN|nr:COQ9 family protein [Alteripontixanthobacter maritimus]RDC59092.1 Ubiquinone biosynthesis protein COQ9, mitochondrial [Alteripontixanthobacter maritimus]
MVQAAAISGDDLTLEELRLALAPTIANEAVFDGWTDEALVMAAEAEDVDVDVARLAFPGGAMQMIGAWIDQVDSAMAAALPPKVLDKMPVRERIRQLVQFRLDAVEGQEEAVRRATAVMAMPQNAAEAARRAWKSADIMWRLAGDTATDYNHYTKRAILSALYASTLAIFVGDDTPDKAETRAFLDRRIEGVMSFEKAKARLLGSSDRERFSITRFLGRLRYPAR